MVGGAVYALRERRGRAPQQKDRSWGYCYCIWRPAQQQHSLHRGIVHTPQLRKPPCCRNETPSAGPTLHAGQSHQAHGSMIRRCHHKKFCICIYIYGIASAAHTEHRVTLPYFQRAWVAPRTSAPRHALPLTATPRIAAHPADQHSACRHSQQHTYAAQQAQPRPSPPRLTYAIQIEETEKARRMTKRISSICSRLRRL